MFAGTGLFGAPASTQGSTFGTNTSSFGFGSNLQNQVRQEITYKTLRLTSTCLMKSDGYFRHDGGARLCAWWVEGGVHRSVLIEGPSSINFSNDLTKIQCRNKHFIGFYWFLCIHSLQEAYSVLSPRPRASVLRPLAPASAASGPAEACSGPSLCRRRLPPSGLRSQVTEDEILKWFYVFILKVLVA